MAANTMSDARTFSTVFQSGNSQALRIPKAFQIQTKRVELIRQAQSIVIRPLADTAAEALADLPPLSAQESQALDAAMDIALNTEHELLPLDEVSDWLSTQAPPRSTRRRTPSKK